jgi:hypothetical protein
MKVMNEYISLKTSNKKITFKLNAVAYMIELSRQFNGEAMKDKITVDPRLLTLSLEELLNKIDITDLSTYIILNHVYVYKNNQTVEVKLNHKGKDISFSITKKEQRDILCCKTKRKDELVKMSFKFIKRKILKEFELKEKLKNKKIGKTSCKNKFFKTFLNGDATGIKFFEFFDLSKKRLKVLKTFSKLMNELKQYKDDKFIKEMIKEYILENSNDLLNEQMGLDGFMTIILSRQHKHSMVVQHILNSLKEFSDFFKL